MKVSRLLLSSEALPENNKGINFGWSSQQNDQQNMFQDQFDFFDIMNHHHWQSSQPNDQQNMFPDKTKVCDIDNKLFLTLIIINNHWWHCFESLTNRTIKRICFWIKLKVTLQNRLKFLFFQNLICFIF